MLPTLLRRAAQQSIPKELPYVYTNPYRAKHSWPPDFAKIDQKHQFRLERRFRRRTKLKWARPRWTKAVKMVQFGSIVFVMVYGVLFLDWNTENSDTPENPPFHSVRNWFFGLTGSVWSNDQVRRQPTSDSEGSQDTSPLAR